MKRGLFILFLITFFSCQKKEEGILTLNLDKSEKALYYSNFVDSVSYITFSTGDTCLLSTIDRIYFDNDTVIIKSRNSDGIFIFTKTGNLVAHINQQGQGPEEYIEPRIVAIDKNTHTIHIADVVGHKLLKFDYQGNYLESILFEEEHQYPHDIAVTSDGNFITMKSANYSPAEKSGVWISNNKYQYQKHILNDVPSGYEFENITTYYNQSPHGLYYYDMNKDYIYLIRNDSAEVLYKIDLKQKFPPSLRKNGAPHPDELKGHANIGDFGITENLILLRYFTFFGEPDPNKWVLIDKKNETISVYDKLVNDIDENGNFSIFMFYVDDYTVCRMMESSENDCNITIQLLYLK